MTPSPSILVIRRDDQFSSDLREAGFRILNLDLIATEPCEDLSDLDEKLSRINEYDGLFFTSPVSAAIFLERSHSEHHFAGSVYVLGDRARSIMTEAGFDVRFSDSANTAAEMISDMGEEAFRGKKLLFVRGDKSLQAIPLALAGKADVDEVVVYETKEVWPDESTVRPVREALENSRIDWVCFFSPTGVRSFQKVFAGLSQKVKTAAIGETTAAEMRRYNLGVDFISPRSSARAFSASLVRHINNSE